MEEGTLAPLSLSKNNAEHGQHDRKSPQLGGEDAVQTLGTVQKLPVGHGDGFAAQLAGF